MCAVSGVLVMSIPIPIIVANFQVSVIIFLFVNIEYIKSKKVCGVCKIFCTFLQIVKIIKTCGVQRGNVDLNPLKFGRQLQGRIHFFPCPAPPRRLSPLPRPAPWPKSSARAYLIYIQYRHSASVSLVKCLIPSQSSRPPQSRRPQWGLPIDVAAHLQACPCPIDQCPKSMSDIHVQSSRSHIYTVYLV